MIRNWVVEVCDIGTGKTVSREVFDRYKAAAAAHDVLLRAGKDAHMWEL